MYCFVSDLEGCLARNGQRRGRARVPEVAIKGKLAKFEPPEFGEGIDEFYDNYSLFTIHYHLFPDGGPGGT